MKILFITCVSDRSELLLIRELHRSGIEIDLVCDPREGEAESLAELGIDVTVLHIKHRFDIKAIRTLRQLTEEKKYDVIYATANRGLSCTLLATIGLPPKIVAYRGTMGHLSYWDPSAHFAHLHRRVSGIVCNCQAVKNHLEEIGLPQEKLHVVYKGHLPEWYEVEDAADLSTFGIPEGAFCIGCIANIRPVKGVDILVRAMKLLTDRADIHALVVGEMRDGTIPKLIEDEDLKSTVHLVGFQSNAREIAKACDITVMPSRAREGIPRAVIESRLIGTPTVVSQVGGLPELVNDEKDGFTVLPNDPKALADRILTLYHSPELREKFSEAGRAYTQKLVNPEKYVDGMKNTFERL